MAKKQKPMDILKEYDLNLQQEMFCQYYTSGTEFFGNGLRSYEAAYDVDTSNPIGYNNAKQGASRLLRIKKICKRINDLIDAEGLNDMNVDKQLFFLLTQNDDFKSKLGAIKEYNKLRQRITERIDIVGLPPVTTIEFIDIGDRSNLPQNADDTTDMDETAEDGESEEEATVETDE